MDLSLIQVNSSGQVSYNNELYQLNVIFPKECGILMTNNSIFIKNITTLDNILTHLNCNNIKIKYLKKPYDMSKDGLLFIPITLIYNNDYRKVNTSNISVLLKLVKKGIVESLSISLDNINTNVMHSYVTDIKITLYNNNYLYKLFFEDLPKVDQQIIITLYLLLERISFINRDVIEYIINILYPI